MGVEFDLKEDFQPQNKEAADLVEQESPYLKEYFASKKHGDSMLKCYPLSYL